MNPYDFSQIDFSEPEIAAELARVYALLLERARCRRQGQQVGAHELTVSGSAPSLPDEQAEFQETPPLYVQEQMFSDEVCNVQQ